MSIAKQPSRTLRAFRGPPARVLDARRARVRVERVPLDPPLTEWEELIAGLIAEVRNYHEIGDLLDMGWTAVRYHATRAALKVPGDLPIQMKLCAWYRGATLSVLTGEGSVR